MDNFQKFPVMDVFFKSYSFWINHLGALFKLALLPLMVFSLVYWFGYVNLVLYGFSILHEGESWGGALSIILQFLSPLVFLPVVPFLTGWCRFCAHEKGTGKTSVGYPFGWSETRFIWKSTQMYLPVFLISALNVAVYAAAAKSGIISSFGMVEGTFLLIGFFLVGSLFLWVRFSPVYPAAALGEKTGFLAAWRLTRGSSLRLMLTWVLILLPAVLIDLILQIVSSVFTNINAPQNNPDEMLRYAVEMSLFRYIFVLLFYGGIMGNALTRIHQNLVKMDKGPELELDVFD